MICEGRLMELVKIERVTHGLGVICEEGVGLVDWVYFCRVAGWFEDKVGFGVCVECVQDRCELCRWLD